MAKEVKKPINKGIAKVPVIIQLEALECGAACLCMILAYYGKWIPLEQVRSDCGVSRDGSNAKYIKKAAIGYGLNTRAYKTEIEALKTSGTFPCIIHWDFNHFVVLDGFKGDKAYLNDPAQGAYSVSMEMFNESFTGICLMFEPSEDFSPSGKKRSMFDFAAKRLKGAGVAVAFAVITAVISALMGIINPAFSRIFIDRLLTYQNIEWLGPFIIILLAFSIVQIIVSAIQAIYTLRINGKFTTVGSSKFMWKVLRLPLDFFSQRMAGDIQERQRSNGTIANTLIDTFAPLGLNTIMLIFYLVVMLRYSWILTLIGLASLVINAIVSMIISKKRVNISRVSMKDSAALYSMTISGIEMIETIKSSGAERGFFHKWSGYQANLNNQEKQMVEMNGYMGAIPLIINSLVNDAVLILGVYFAMQGEFTVGMVMAFQGFLQAFVSPAMSFIGAGQTIQEMRTSMERVTDVLEYKDDDIFNEEKLEKDVEYSKLQGNIEIKNVTFGYSKYGNAVVKDFNMKIEPGKSVAIVGGSGCGKSTMSKLISGLYKPWKGEILFDGKAIDKIPKAIFKSSLAVVDQDIILFEDTIANNIRMWDTSIEDYEVILAARDAQLHDDIMQRPKGYKHKLIEGGKDFSGGQRQRIEIARVLAQDPTIIIMDEATSALDAKTEHDVVQSIKNRGITCIVIAHRLSTIRSCDEIIVMQSGEIVARGTHEQLMKSSFVYQELVTNE